MRARVNLIDGRTEYRYGHAASIEATSMTDSVDSESKSGDDNNAVFGKFVGEIIGNFFAVFSIMAAADDGDRCGSTGFRVCSGFYC